MTLQTDACLAMCTLKADLAAQQARLYSLINQMPSEELPTLLEQFEQSCHQDAYAVPTDALQRFLKAQLERH